ncbi:hypothetical protein [Nocardia donostiensis]|uniref:Uncharacterized protein n=1 Tax=Nocardia donostiensis TaxID=1538463 RepID=A0A1W0B8S3_9NOCA|nr:hypothetical protein [Nocardia donostiensis]ONM50493.1 hypothetical protein B0T46_00805 [Nocardia donostiensis]OQS17270.1 hypothetical protein B0T36_01345 [Nocardia donostiensis]OQS18851.1 hypothetical protein B0T44_17195 [Nocardia donostiensis]
MPLTEGRYAERTGPRRLWFWIRRSFADAVRRYRRDPRDTGGGYVMHREWGAWVLRPVTGWRSLRWVSPPVRATRAVPAGDRDAAVDWHAQALGM